MIITLKKVMDEDGLFTISDGTNDYIGVIPLGDEGCPDKTIKVFASGIASHPLNYVEGEACKNRLGEKIVRDIAESSLSKGDVLFDNTESEV